MSKIGLGYGSEWHTLRFLGRHGQRWNQIVEEVLTDDGVRDITCIKWCDFPFSAKSTTHDQEIKGMDFLAKEHRDTWTSTFWPDPRSPDVDRDGILSWDALGQVFSAERPGGEWLLVEAKSHKGELTDSPKCGAGGKSLETITDSLKRTFVAMG